MRRMRRENALSSRMSSLTSTRSIFWTKISKYQVLAARSLICANSIRRYTSEVGQCRWARKSYGRKLSMNSKSQAPALLRVLLWETTTTAAFWLTRINSSSSISQRCSSRRAVESRDLDQEDQSGVAMCHQCRQDMEAIIQMAWCLHLKPNMDRVMDKM